MTSMFYTHRVLEEYCQRHQGRLQVMYESRRIHEACPLVLLEEKKKFIEYTLILDRILIGLQQEPTRLTLPITGLRALLTKADPGIFYDSQVKLMGMYRPIRLLAIIGFSNVHYYYGNEAQESKVSANRSVLEGDDA